MAREKSAHLGYNKKMRVLAFDPGETTGVALIDTRAHEFFVGNFIFPDNLYTFLSDSLTPETLLDHIIIEQFILYAYKAKAKSWSKFPEIRAQGAIEYAAFQADIPYTLQTASVAKQAIKDSFLKEHNLYKTNAHERDAVRHAVTFLLRFHGKELRTWLSLVSAKMNNTSS